MIHSIKCNKKSFKEIKFDKGLNIVLADRVLNTSSKKQTRNGAGKTTIIEIIHFCLGARVSKNSVFKNKNLIGWTFILSIDIDKKLFNIERNTDNPSRIYISSKKDIGDTFGDLKYDKKQHKYYISVSKFNDLMLEKFYGLEKDMKIKYCPSYRELFSYSVRRGLDGYKNAFEYFSRQKAYSKQLCNAYFLNLSLDCASEFQEIKDKKSNVDNFKKLSKTGLLGNYNIGKLNTEVISKEKEINELKNQLDSFKVHPQYNEISYKVNLITQKIHDLANECIIKEMLLKQYQESAEDSNKNISIEQLTELYEEAGVLFSKELLLSLEEVVEFHKKLMSNRESYLCNEISTLNEEINEIKNSIKSFSDERSKHMEILKTHGALDEYMLLQNKYIEIKESLELSKEKLKAAENIEELSSELKIENEKLLIKARRDYNDRSNIRSKAISIFSDNIGYLYPYPGNLNIDLNENGYDFSIDIKNSRSQGVNYMKTFSYDFMIYDLNKNRKCFPDFIVHDSTIFDGVDERQISRALMLAYKKSQKLGIQYICMMNSDNVPNKEFDKEFSTIFNNCIRLRISDDSETGGVLGIRF